MDELRKVLISLGWRPHNGPMPAGVLAMYLSPFGDEAHVLVDNDGCIGVYINTPPGDFWDEGSSPVVLRDRLTELGIEVCDI